ncbi:hypothetical protein HYU23_01305 [Candidatus Woesearchaeota archaeon]|nr:hypothetical protein [Candidatus Woesearchaeota archaeon]
MKKLNLEKTTSIFSSFSGETSFLGGYQVCHSICTVIISLLSLIGITIIGMPMLFLQKIAIPFWIIALILFSLTLFLYFKKRCISKNILIFNLGIIIASTPFNELGKPILIFWIVGGFIILLSLFLYIKPKIIQQLL